MKHLSQVLTATLILLILLSISLTSQAIVMRHDVSVEKYQVKQAQYESVIDLSFLTGTLIAPQWILTAAHGTPYMPGHQEITINHQQYYVRYIIAHPDYNQDNLSHDIALLKLDRPVLNVVSTGIYTLDDEKSQHVWFVGRGDVGTGDVGITGTSTSLHHAENIIEHAQGIWLRFDFDAPEKQALALEGISGPGDSGGPAFINTSTGLKVAGVSSHQRNNDNGEGLYGVEEFYTRSSSHQQWLETVMAKPSDKLEKIALKRAVYPILEASKAETTALSGRYELADKSEFFIEPCAEGLCYRWGGLPEQTVIFKAAAGRWFTPKLNRSFSINYRKNGAIKDIVMDDFHGQRQLTKKAVNQVTH